VSCKVQMYLARTKELREASFGSKADKPGFMSPRSQQTRSFYLSSPRILRRSRRERTMVIALSPLHASIMIIISCADYTRLEIIGYQG